MIGRTIIAATLLLLAGCVSYETKQMARFLDNEGTVIEVEYQHGDGDHVNTYMFNGKEREFRSKLRVKVDMPGNDFVAYQCMNILSSGTMYRTDDEKWLFHAGGIVGSIYKQTPDKSDYELVFQGVICHTPRKDGVR